MDEEAIKRVLDAFNRHDLDAITSFFTDDCVFYMPRPAPSGKDAVGTDGARALLACDLFELRDGKIARKDSFWKIVERQ